MWRYLVGAAAAALLIVAGMMLQAVRPPTALPLTAMPAAAASTSVEAQDVTGGVAVPDHDPRGRRVDGTEAVHGHAENVAAQMDIARRDPQVGP